MRRSHRVTVLALCALLPVGAGAAHGAPAKKKTPPRYQFQFEGRGFGHGIGMSQYGAYGAAKSGMSGEAIIAMYFPGTKLTPVPTTTVRVLIAAAAPTAALTSSGGWTATHGSGPATPLPAVPLTFTADGTTTILTGPDGTEVLRVTGPLTIAPEGSALLAVAGRRYRGVMRLGAAGSKVTVINHVDLEQYLLSVVPLEMPASWDAQALRAQAIAARSYALATRKVTGDFDMYRDERSQMYGGLGAEDARTSAAVVSTAGLVATFENKVATTFFSSTSGGRTENIENVFLGSRPLPYLVSVDDARFDAISPRHVWTGVDRPLFTDAKLAKLLGVKRPVRQVKILSRGVSGRAIQVRITTRAGAVKIVTGPKIRAALGLRSGWFEVKRQIRK